jgi:hypothetical protein
MDILLDIKLIYKVIIGLFVFSGIIYFLYLSENEKKRRINQLLLGALILVFFYENLGTYLSSKKIVNHWVYNVFFFHVATWIHLSIVKEFILSPLLRKIIVGFSWSLFFFSAVPYSLGVFPYNEVLSYTALLSSSLMIVSCAFFFFEFLSNDTYLPINSLRFPGFWIAMALLLFYSVNFLLFASLGYMINHYPEFFNQIIVKFPIFSSGIVYFTFFMVLIKWSGFKNYNLNSINESG